MDNSDYPGLYATSDDASKSAQKWYLGLTAAQLVIFFAVSFAGAISRVFAVEHQRSLFLGIAVALVVGLLCITAGRERKFDKVWFDGRAVAESVKTLTWRFMMNSKPFINAETAEVDFLRELDQVRKWR